MTFESWEDAALADEEETMNRQMMRASRAVGRGLMKLDWSPWEDVSNELERMRTRAGKDPKSFIGAWKNNHFVIQLYRQSTAVGDARLMMIRRNDEQPGVSWAMKQRIKNELLGPEVVAIEVFPAESELVDDAHMYHLWTLPDGFSLPFRLT